MWKIFWFVLILSSCSNTIKYLHTEGFNKGGAVVRANAKLGYFNQEGNAEACKLVCSDDLPSGLRYEFNNGTCKVGISTK